MLADPCIVFPYQIYISTIQVQYKEFFVVQDWYWSVYYKAVNDQLHTIEFLPIQCKVSTITGTVKKKTLGTQQKIDKFVVHFFHRLLTAQLSDMTSHACEY